MARAGPAAGCDQHDHAARGREGLDSVHAGAADGCRPGHKVGLQQRRQHAVVRHHSSPPPGSSSTTTRASTCSARWASATFTGNAHPPDIRTRKAACISPPPISRRSASCISPMASGTAGAFCLPGLSERATTRHVDGCGRQLRLRISVVDHAPRRGGCVGRPRLWRPAADRDSLAPTVAVVHAWNVFGTPARNIFGPLLDATSTDHL